MKKKLKDICNGFTKNIAQKELDELNGDYEIYGASGLIKKIDYYVSEVPYIGIVKDGSGVGRVSSYPAKSSLIGTMQYIVPNNDIDLQYLMYALRSMNLGNLFKGAAIPHIYFKEYKEFNVNVPSLPDQQKIATHLDSIQSAIDNKKQQLAQLDELVKSKFVEMFGENPVESGKWKVETLGSKSELITKGASPRWQGVEYQSEGTLFVTSENVREGYVDLTKSKYLPDEINEILPRSILKKNDVLINIVGASIGRAAIYEFEQKANINQAVALVRLNSSDLDKTFLLIYLNSELAMKLYQSMIKGGARDNLSLKNISDLSIPVPPIELQTTFAEYVQKIDSAKSIIKTQLVDLQELLDSKIDEYFGE